MSIRGTLLLTQPTPFTTPSYEKLYSISYDVGLNGVTQQELTLAATQCGTQPYDQGRATEYTAWRQGGVRIEDLALHYFGTPVAKNEVWRRWMGPHALNVF